MVLNVRCLQVLAMVLAALSIMAAQEPKPPAPSNDAWTTKTFDLKYIDPEQVARVFEGQSHVMDANRELKLLTARGSAAFLKEVEDTIKRLDVPPPIPPNTQVTVYILAGPTQAPAGTALPAELKSLAKELPPKLADMQMFRVRVGQPGEASSPNAFSSPSVALARIRVDSASVSPGGKGEIVSLNGLRVWLNIPPADPAAPKPSSTPKTEPDVTADIDLTPNEPAVVAKIGIEKPVAVVVRAAIVH